jgi:hypothetical protein
MNAKIKQLMDRSFTDEQGERFDPERFAELIVRECMRVVDSHGKGWAHLTGTESNRIRQHFGIAE